MNVYFRKFIQLKLNHNIYQVSCKISLFEISALPWNIKLDFYLTVPSNVTKQLELINFPERVKLDKVRKGTVPGIHSFLHQQLKYIFFIQIFCVSLKILSRLFSSSFAFLSVSVYSSSFKKAKQGRCFLQLSMLCGVKAQNADPLELEFLFKQLNKELASAIIFEVQRTAAHFCAVIILEMKDILCLLYTYFK